MASSPKSGALCAVIAVAGLAACAGGTSYTEKLLKQVMPLDALTVGAIGVVGLGSVEADLGWSTSVQSSGTDRYRISIARMAGMGRGEGEFNLRFASEARRIAAERACRFRVLAYEERFESRLLGASRIAEGEIECR